MTLELDPLSPQPRIPLMDVPCPNRPACHGTTHYPTSGSPVPGSMTCADCGTIWLPSTVKPGDDPAWTAPGDTDRIEVL